MGQENKEDVAEIRRDASEIKDCTTIEEMRAEIERQQLHNIIVHRIIRNAIIANNKISPSRSINPEELFVMLSYHLLKQNERLKKQLEEKFLKEPIRVTGFGMAGSGGSIMIIDDPVRQE